MKKFPGNKKILLNIVSLSCILQIFLKNFMGFDLTVIYLPEVSGFSSKLKRSS